MVSGRGGSAGRGRRDTRDDRRPAGGQTQDAVVDGHAEQVARTRDELDRPLVAGVVEQEHEVAALRDLDAVGDERQRAVHAGGGRAVEHDTVQDRRVRERRDVPGLATAGQPVPDLCIRTGGEHRISNFLLWQLAYSELYFSDLYWPDFKHEAMRKALANFATRQRRFGKTGDQVAGDPRGC